MLKLLIDLLNNNMDELTAEEQNALISVIQKLKEGVLK